MDGPQYLPAPDAPDADPLNVTGCGAVKGERFRTDDAGDVGQVEPVALVYLEVADRERPYVFAVDEATAGPFADQIRQAAVDARLHIDQTQEQRDR